MNLMTPETAATTHYFWGVARAYQTDDAELTEYIREQIHETFNEDKEVLEAQQRTLGAHTDNSFASALRTDAGPIRARRLVRQLIEAEGSPTRPA